MSPPAPVMRMFLVADCPESLSVKAAILNGDNPAP
jgi:hypothetical protein